MFTSRLLFKYFLPKNNDAQKINNKQTNKQKQNKTKPNETKQNRTKQNKTEQNKTNKQIDSKHKFPSFHPKCKPVSLDPLKSPVFRS